LRYLLPFNRQGIKDNKILLLLDIFSDFNHAALLKIAS